MNTPGAQEPLTTEEIDLLRRIGERRGLQHGKLMLEGIFKDGDIQEATVHSADRVIIRSQNKRKV